MKEVQVFVNTRPYAIFPAKHDQNYVEIGAAEDMEVCCLEALRKRIRMKKFTASIKHNGDGYYAEIFSEELQYDEDGILIYVPKEVAWH